MHGGRLARCVPILSLGLALLAGCSRGSDVPEALMSVAQAEVTPGEGVGTLRLSQTTLASALQQYGQGRASVVVGDEYAFELDYGEGSVSLLFMATPECHTQIMREGPRSAADLLQQEGRLPASLPACGESALVSVALAAPEDSAAGFFEGRVAGKVGLGSTLDEVLVAHGPSQNINGLLLAGSRPDESSEMYTYDYGLALYAGPAPDGSDEGSPVVRKIAIFLP